MVRVEGKSVTHEATLGKRQPVRHKGQFASAWDGQFASAWDLDLGDANVPISRLTLTVKEGFTRPYELVVMDRDRTREPVASGGEADDKGRPIDVMEKERPGGGEMAGGGSDGEFDEKGDRWRGLKVTREGAEISFPEISARKLRLIVIDSRNPPLTIEKATFSAPARQVIFPVTEDLKGPLRLYSGNPDAPPPNYVFASRLPLQFESKRVELGDRQDNPIYVPPPKPWTERWPYLADVILVGACAALAGLLMMLARGAIKRHDALPEATRVPPPPA
jgi:hypothetical protein